MTLSKQQATSCFWGCMVAIGMFASMGASAQPGVDAPRPTGKDVFVAHCASCHGDNLGGGQFAPGLKGGAFSEKWAKQTPELLRFITTSMPPAEPGSLTATEYNDLLQLLTVANGWGNAAAESSPPVADKSDRTANMNFVVKQGVGGVPAAPEVFRDAVYDRALAERRTLLAALSPVTEGMLQAPPSDDWLTWRRTQDNISFSPLTQIDRKNAAQMSVLWAWSLPLSANEIAPLVHDGIMFIASANQVQALDATNGTLLWRYTRELEPRYKSALNEMQRNIAIYGDNIYVATGDRHVAALDAKSGRVLWDHEVVPPSLSGVILSSGPIVAHGKIIQGTSYGPACRGGCMVVGLDAQTGQEDWRFHTIAQPGQPGGDSWNGSAVDQRSGGAVWIPGAYDSDLDLLYFGTGQTYGVGTLLQPKDGKAVGKNDGLYTDSTIALNPETGKLIWHFQHFPREVWDLDEVFERSLITLKVHGVERQLIVNIGKAGIMDVLDRANGKYVFSKDFKLNNIVTKIDQRTGQRSIDPAKIPQPNKTIEVCPSAEGARNWMSIAYNPETSIMYVPLEETCMDFAWRPGTSADPADHNFDIGWSVKPVPNSDGNYARLDAVDMSTGKTLWSQRSRAPFSSSLVATKGGVIFSGSRDRAFQALDDRTGETLWRTRLNAAPSSSPITYSVNHKQYVAVVAGGGGGHDLNSAEITPEIENSAASTTLWVFGLPDQP